MHVYCGSETLCPKNILLSLISRDVVSIHNFLGQKFLERSVRGHFIREPIFRLDTHMNFSAYSILVI
jgi:hypothetical protein